MTIFIKFFGTLMMLSGISLLIKPVIIFGWIEGNTENYSLYISAIIVRLFFGVLFIITARKSKHPIVIKFLGYIFIIAAIILIILGQVSFQKLITSLIPYVRPYTHIAGVLSVLFGGFIIYTFSTNNQIGQK